jgi:two-component system, chemotaxis family, protein-glutamate methylesterase/glutaminase
MSSSEPRAQRRARVLIVDDSDLMRALITDIIETTDQFKVCGEARTGLEAIKLVHELNPDLVTLDIEMPDLNGLETLGYIMSEAPRPVIIVSSHTDAIAQSVIRAFDSGAVEIVPKPAGDDRREADVLRKRLVEALHAAAGAELRNLRPRQSALPNAGARAWSQQGYARCAVAIAASTGGPRALAEIVPRLPADFPCAVLIVQHMPATFTGPFANRLAELSNLPVREAQHGEAVHAGVVYVAPGGKHVTLKRQRDHIAILLTDEDPLWGVRPAADLLLRDVARYFGPASVGLVLTGMGRDGAEGLRHIQEVGGWTAVQDEASAVIYGMPKNAAPFAAEHIPLSEIADSLTVTARRVCRRRGF